MAAVRPAVGHFHHSAGRVARPDHRARATIDGPTLTPPDVVARDHQGRVTLRATRLDQPLVLDGRLDEGIYAQTPHAGDFIQTDQAANRSGASTWHASSAA